MPAYARSVTQRHGASRTAAIRAGLIRAGLIRAGLITGIAVLIAPIAPAHADPAPGDLGEARAEVGERKEGLQELQVRLAQADARLADQVAKAERLIERYNGERVRLRKAGERYTGALAAYRDAQRSVGHSRRAVAALAAAAYRTDGGVSPMTEMVNGEGGPQGFVDRVGMINVLGERSRARLDEMRASSLVAEVLRRQAAEALAEQRDATRRAERLKGEAERAVADQRAAVQSIEADKRRMADALGVAREQVADLESAAEDVTAEVKEAVQSGSGGAAKHRGDTAADWALRQLGKPYVWAADGPDTFDCSGLTMRAWERVGVRLDHWTGTQWTSGPHIPTDQLRRGDLVFFGKITSNPGDIHHVGMYIGGGRMVEAPYTGANVRISSIFRNDLVGATRPRG